MLADSSLIWLSPERLYQCITKQILSLSTIELITVSLIEELEQGPRVLKGFAVP